MSIGANETAWVRTALVLTSFLMASSASAEPEVRILLRDGRSAFNVSREALKVWADAQVVPAGREVRLRFLNGGQVEVRGRQRIRGQRVRIEGQGPLRVGDGLYLGTIEVDGDAGTVVNGLPVETYLLGIVGSEMPASWPAAALEAQAVAARTYALQARLRMRSAGRGFDLHDSVLSQVYKGAADIAPSVVAAVEATQGLVMAFDHFPAEALFHSTCGGRTRSAEEVFGNEVPYLQARRCKWCQESSRHRWSLDIPLKRTEDLLRAAGLVDGKLRRVDGDAERVVIKGRRRREVGPRRLRAALGPQRLFSTDFEARTRRGRLHLEGKGFGHQVGMCQWGARGMAREGRDFRAILAHYYPGVPIKRAW